MVVSDQVPAPAALPPDKRHLVSTEVDFKISYLLLVYLTTLSS